jgi:hypothetical protein
MIRKSSRLFSNLDGEMDREELAGILSQARLAKQGL